MSQYPETPEFKIREEIKEKQKSIRTCELAQEGDIRKWFFWKLYPHKTNVRLPKLDLPHFTGDVLEWNSFWELYNVSVHHRGDLELIKKFSYLQSLLTRDALKLISGFKLGAANYSQAISLLRTTYGKKDEIKRVLVRRLLEMESPSPNSESLQSFRVNFECSIRSLESENLELNELYTILLHGNLPKSVSETVKRRYGDDWLVFDTFKIYLEEEVHNLRSFVSADVNKPGTLSTISTFTVNQSQSVKPKSKGNVNKFSSQQTGKCALCEGEHWRTQCETYARSCNAPPVQETQVTMLKLATNEEVIEATHKFHSDIRNNLDILWNLDKVGIDCNEFKEHDRRVLEDFENTIVYSEMEKQYVVALPWNSNKSRLPSNFGMALGWVKQQCTKFQKDKAYLNHYQKILKDQEDRGFIKKVDKNNVVENCHYLAHHSVQKDSATSPIRIAFYCSWRQGKNGLSLYDCLWTGPHITTDLLKVLLQFRTNNYACISDIEKAFLMVQLREEDRNYTRFLWLQDPTDPNSELIIYRFRWEREYLTSLRETHRVGIRHESWPKMGDVMLIHDEGPRSRWKLGQIVKLHVGPDDVLRVVTLKTPQGQVMRPVVKLYPLELWQETDVVIPERTDNKST
ncbi:uncharacterized protein [Palaemon carinicauda]|uniref:uncharacterized protein n=1 Tax=Palaemon carinicauda TaxID=392227 RepID=UPI0035B591E7